MRISSLLFENYRAFVNETAIELRPLTLLFGYNSAGKSSTMRLLPLLAASSEPTQSDPLAMDSIATRGASFRDLLSRQSSSPTLKVGVTFSSRGETDVKLNYLIRDLADRQFQVIERLAVQSDRHSLTALWDTQSPDPLATARRYEFRIDNTALGTLPLEFRGLVFEPLSELPLADVANRASEAMSRLPSSVHWLNSLRAIPARAARFGNRPRQMSPDGSNAGAYLAHDSIGSGELLRDSSGWFEHITGRRLAVSHYSAGGDEQYSILVTLPDASPALAIPLVDTGEGMAQVMPVIVLGCLARLGHIRKGSILAIEHPELHLHPAAHAELAHFFCTVATASSQPTVLIETHSENLLLRVQIAIARGEISEQDVVVHWVRELEDGRSVIDTITFDDAARPQGSGWPPGVFREDAEQARTLLDLRRQRTPE